MLHTVWSAVDNSVSTPAKSVRQFEGWDAKARALHHASVLARVVVDAPVFMVTDPEGNVIWRSRTV